MPFPVLLSTLIRSRFQAKPATLLIPIDFIFLFTVEEYYGTRYQSGSFSLINVGSGFYCLRSFFPFLFQFFVVLVPKIRTSCALASENKDSYLLRRDTVWGRVQCKIACCSSWTSSSASHKSQVGEDPGFHVAVSKRRVWARSLN